MESIAATDFDFGVMILTSSFYTGKEFRTTPISGLGGVSARVDHVQNHNFMPHFGGSLFSTGGLFWLLTLDLWSRRPKLSINQVGNLWLLWPWNDDSLKNSQKKKITFCVIWSILSSYHKWYAPMYMAECWVLSMWTPFFSIGMWQTSALYLPSSCIMNDMPRWYALMLFANNEWLKSMLPLAVWRCKSGVGTCRNLIKACISSRVGFVETGAVERQW